MSEARNNVSAPPTKELSDEALILSLQSGDYNALQKIAERYGSSLYGFLARYLGDAHLAEDVYQDTLLRVAEKHLSFNSARSFRPWLFAIAANLAKDECRKRKQRNRELPAELVAPKSIPGAPEVEAERREELNILGIALSELDADSRAIVLLHFKEGMRYREIAEALLIPMGTVKSRIHSAVKRLSVLWNQSAAVVATSGTQGGK